MNTKSNQRDKYVVHFYRTFAFNCRKKSRKNKNYSELKLVFNNILL